MRSAPLNVGKVDSTANDNSYSTHGNGGLGLVVAKPSTESYDTASLNVNDVSKEMRYMILVGLLAVLFVWSRRWKCRWRGRWKGLLSGSLGW